MVIEWLSELTLYQWLCLLGIPSLIAAILKAVFSTMAKVKALSLGVKALLRAQMISDYNKWTERGYAPIYAKQNFENCWEQYHLIKGPNGVMDGLHNNFMSLPTDKPEQQKAGD